tara:strand:+ start:123 stop:377 length:255 start_codon:yes stop_codon:yes gene_type:complete
LIDQEQEEDVRGISSTPKVNHHKKMFMNFPLTKRLSSWILLASLSLGGLIVCPISAQAGDWWTQHNSDGSSQFCRRYSNKVFCQ